jgi:tRNA(fMet)-specific endonuclease VapC
MIGNSLALDTNIAVQVLKDARDVLEWLSGFAELFLPVIVIGELRYGAMNSARSAANLARVDALASRCRQLLVDASTADVYAQVRLALKRRGSPIPENDVRIAAQCVQHALPLATLDRHFAAVDGLAVIQP